ncbi:uncharacterized protein LOC116346822 [Contarinia nasturtii]|uniref:uncharacterized protein LOC116346822 n=1 Tax=Contarinia nasturtii TaxID=265458 RepID=UPI0012D3B5C8|nr:uncharacterized protein LOC116346822 [Contarinia nasturtii]XP_031632914.1 uncharacterized protein LOC116346822 [Contarinia nasturtii]
MSKNNVSQEIQDILLDHVLFSRFLPQEKPRYIYEEMLMVKMIENVESLSKYLMPTKTVEMLQRLKRVHFECTPNVISEEINDLEPGDTFAMYVRRQNCAIMIHVPANELISIEETRNVIVATFPGNLYRREIYEHDSDIEFNYPLQALKVKFSEMLQSEDFANQLSILTEELPIETKIRNYVSKWLTTLLMDEKSRTVSTKEFPVITKKIRDAVMGETKHNFFRRSSFYMSIKVMLQHSLTMQLGHESGKFLYKIVMLKFLVEMCDIYKDPECDPLNTDLLSQMIAKLARRIEKLMQTKHKKATNIEKFYDSTIRDAKQTIIDIRAKINEQIESIQLDDEENSKLQPLSGLNFESDIVYSMPKLCAYLRDRMEIQPKRNSNFRHKVKSYRRYKQIKHIEHIEEGVELGMYFADFECLVLYQMSMKDEQHTPDDLRIWFVQYTEYAMETYTGDPLMISRILLVCLKLIAMLDRRATIEFPLLKKHRCGINSNIINSLLLPQRIDMDTAHRLEKYFRIRNENATDPSLIEEKSVSEKSFSVKFVKDDDDMLQMRNEILRIDEQNKQKKKMEWAQGREKVKHLRDQANQLDHTFFTNRYGEVHHDKRCNLCHLRKKAQNYWLEAYECLLPKKDIEQFAVVFELGIPDTIACLRDILYCFTTLCVKSTEKLSIKANWVEYREIAAFNRSTSKYVTLGSTKRRRSENLHVDENVRQFIVPNSLNCVLHVHDMAIPTSLSDNAIKDICTFKAQNEYLGLQWTVQSTNHTEAEVLARQSECPQNLSLAEYKNFGMLRADGHRLQLRKLHGMIATDALSFEKESVLSLILQTLWECGVSGDAKSIRESHIDLNDSSFCSAIIDSLADFVDQQKDNWMHPFKLLMATLIAVRAFEINEIDFMAEKIVELLHSIRAIVQGWIEKMEKTIHDAQNLNEESEKELRLKLIYVAVTGALTFFVNKKHKYYDIVFTKDANNRYTSTQLWLHFIILMRNHMNLCENHEDQLPSNLRVFLRLVEIAGINLEPKMKELIKQDLNEVFDLIQKHWFAATNYKPSTMDFSEEFSHILVIETTIDSTIQKAEIDIITGKFLVNGSPLSRLPPEMTQHDGFRRIFGNAAFEVRLNAHHRYCTVQKYNDITYEFENYNDNFIVTERKAKGYEKEYIHYTVFGGDFPHLLVANYSHWWNKNENCIEFRQRVYGRRDFSKETPIDYRLDLHTFHVIQTKTKRPMLDFKTQSYNQITRQLRRLEHVKFIHVLLDRPNMATVELPQMKLKFTINCSDEAKLSNQVYLESNEFSGMRVSHKQKIGTLYGLNHGLILECVDPTNKTKILLMPHGPIEIVCTDLHVSVNIDTKMNIKNPPFYHYQVDEYCHQLKASSGSHASWFFMAYLHAITSHGQIEPLTGMSGTERALQILQSAYAWSSSPYEPEEIEMLDLIAKLSPLRKLNEHNQTVTWPSDIPAHSAQDSFVFIVKKLLADSQRLYGLYSKDKPKNIEIDTDLNINEREYRRCLQMQPNLRVSDLFIEHKVLTTSLPEMGHFLFSESTQFVSILYHQKTYKVPSELNLGEFLTNRDVLKGTINKGCIPNILHHSGYEKFADLWICLYDAVRTEEISREKLALILSLFAHQKEGLGPILALQAIAMNPTEFEDLCPPSVETYQTACGTYDDEKVANILRSCCYKTCEHRGLSIVVNGNESNIDGLTAIIDGVMANISEDWPCDSVDLVEKWTFENKEFEFNFYVANQLLNEQLTIWHNNHKLNEFIEEVEHRLKSLPGSGVHLLLPKYHPFVIAEPKNWAKFQLNIDEKIRENLDAFNDEATALKAHMVWENETTECCSSKEWWDIIENILNSNRTDYLIASGLFPRIVPSWLLPKIIATDTDERLKAMIGAWAISIVHEQREQRIERYSQRPELKYEMEIENDNKPHVNWKPHERPEWLIFEIEQNLTIRRIQIEIAKRMIEPQTTAAKHSVMQLNMGEGKTAVIVPIVASILADGNQACQITVLKSLLARNQKTLRQLLGGLLNRRLYIVPCRRDMPIFNNIQQIQDMYEECKSEKGVILTLPEYRLSLQLKIYEPIPKGNIKDAKKMLDVHKWINANVRNILDESDAILQANYQLIYTVGNQLPPDSGAQRWLVTQAVLKRIPHRMHELYKKYGKERIEFDSKKFNYRPDAFTPCRILDETIFDDLKKALIDDFLNGQMDISFPEITESAKQSIKNVISEKKIDKKIFHTFENMFSEKHDQNTIMILSGLLRFEVLKLVLTKRWRVNYGVNAKSIRKMAVPFKAKDIASENSEFGHPDVSICFTQLSYYYSGLTDAQLYHLFNYVLENKPNAKEIYDKWIESIPKKRINGSIRFYKSINLDNMSQRKYLFSLLSHNMHVIDFWLAESVFPYEAKVFERKLMSTSWDLTCDQLVHCSTGFSGTNDTKNVLPLSVEQNDLPELEKTNEYMQQVLLLPENQSYACLPANVSGTQILVELTKKNIPVLVDSGALMIELTNEQVAIEWLKMASETLFDACLYFDSRDVLLTIDRNGVITEFDGSVYRDNLSKCLVYLDDVHTRGTDLKFPLNWMACVTLSGDITCDKTVQSCMRMRQLGKNHSICFWASYEADICIRKICNLSAEDKITNENVIDFICNNSNQFEKTNMVHWTAAALNYTKKSIGHKLFENNTDEDAMEDLYDICVDEEYVTLEKTYGDKDEAHLTDIAWAKFDRLGADYKSNKEIRMFVRDMQDSVFEKLTHHASDVKQFSHALDEEQEKELEQQEEEERIVERPPAVEAATHKIDKRLESLILNGVTDNIVETLKTQRSLFTLAASLTHTQLFRTYKKNKDAWSNHILVTKDFKTVIASSSQSCDEFLRPIWWIAQIKNAKGNDLLLLMSSFECDLFLSAFRKSTNAALYMYRARLSKSHCSLVQDPRLVITAMDTLEDIDIHDEVQIGFYAGIMFFQSEDEQNAYCNFLGLIPRPRTHEQDMAFEKGTIQAKGFVPMGNRQYSESISSCVGHCQFQENPVDLGIKLIEAHHQNLLKESHVASILEQCTKRKIDCINGE